MAPARHDLVRLRRPGPCCRPPAPRAQEREAPTDICATQSSVHLRVDRHPHLVRQAVWYKDSELLTLAETGNEEVSLSDRPLTVCSPQCCAKDRVANVTAR